MQLAEDLYQELKQKKLEATGNKRKKKSQSKARTQSENNSKKARTYEDRGSPLGKSFTKLLCTCDNENEQELQECDVGKLFQKESRENDDVHRDDKKSIDQSKSPVPQTTQHDHSSSINTEQILKFYYHSIMQSNRNALYPNCYVSLINNMMNNTSSGMDEVGDPISNLPLFYQTHSSYGGEISMNSIQNSINFQTTFSNKTNNNRHHYELQHAYQFYREFMLNRNSIPFFPYKNPNGSFLSVLKPT